MHRRHYRCSKGVMLSHTNLCTSAPGTLASKRVRAQTRVTYTRLRCSTSPISSVGPLRNCSAAHTFSFVESFDPVAVIVAVAEHKVTGTLLVPTMIQALVDNPAIGSYDIAALHDVMYGASLAALGRIRCFSSSEP